MAKYIITNEETAIPFETASQDTARILQNCKNLLLTQMGEVPYDRMRGLDPDLFHQPIDQMRIALLPALDSMLKYEPRAEVVEASAENLEGLGILIKMVVNVEE